MTVFWVNHPLEYFNIKLHEAALKMCYIYFQYTDGFSVYWLNYLYIFWELPPFLHPARLFFSLSVDLSLALSQPSWR